MTPRQALRCTDNPVYQALLSFLISICNLAICACRNFSFAITVSGTSTDFSVAGLTLTWPNFTSLDLAIAVAAFDAVAVFIFGTTAPVAGDESVEPIACADFVTRVLKDSGGKIMSVQDSRRLWEGVMLSDKGTAHLQILLSHINTGNQKTEVPFDC